MKIGALISFAIAAGAVVGSAQASWNWETAPRPQWVTLSGALSRIFDGQTNFTAVLVQRIQQSESQPGGETRNHFAFEDGKSRLDWVAPTYVPHLMSVGCSWITRPESQFNYTVCPTFESFVATPIYESISGPAAAKCQVTRTELGHEKVEAQDCRKQRVVIIGTHEYRLEATVWFAAEPREFPFKVEHTQHGEPVTFWIKEVQFNAAEPAQFRVPESFKEYGSAQEMLSKEAWKRYGSAMERLRSSNPR